MNVIGAGGGNHDDLVTLCMNDWLLNFCWQESELMFEHCVLCTINFPLPFPVPMPINIKSSKLNPIERLFTCRNRFTNVEVHKEFMHVEKKQFIVLLLHNRLINEDFNLA